MTTQLLDVDQLLKDESIHILVCCGSGGVGKTTTAAALGVRAAELGRHVVVLTIDPARRLAQSLGLTSLDNEPRLVAGVGDATTGGSLRAMMLDMKRTFDEIVESHADPERAETIFANPFYQALSTSFAGTQEYMAMEKLGQLHARLGHDNDWDLVIVDTPPSRSALDFLDAPRRLGSFLDGRLMRLLAAPARAGGRLSVRVVNAGFGFFSGVLTRILGAQVLRDIQGFVGAFDALFSDFRVRAEATFDLLQSGETAFVVVATPEPDALREASYFVERLDKEQMPLAGLVLNRVQPAVAIDLTAEAAVAAAQRLEARGRAHSLTASLLRLHADAVALRERQRHLSERFTAAHRHVPVVAVAALAEDVHDLDSLREIGELLRTGDDLVHSPA